MFRDYPIEPNTEKWRKLLRDHANCWEAASVLGVSRVNPTTWEALAEGKWNETLTEPKVVFGSHGARIKALWEEHIELVGEARYYGGIGYKRHITAFIDWVEIRKPPQSTTAEERTALFFAPNGGSQSALWCGLAAGNEKAVSSDPDIYARIQHQLSLTRQMDTDVVCYAHDLDAIAATTVPVDLEYQNILVTKRRKFWKYYLSMRTGSLIL